MAAPRRRQIVHRAPGGQGNSNQLNEFLRDIERFVGSYGELPVKGSLVMKEEAANLGSVLNEEVLQEFARDFMNTVFIPEVLNPAYLYGEGLNGEGNGGVSNLYGHTPIIEKGFGAGRIHDPEVNFDWEKGQGSAYTVAEAHIGGKRRGARTADDYDRLERAQHRAEEDEGVQLTRGLSQRWREGFEDLFKNITTVQAFGDGSGIGIGPRNRVLSQKLNEYSVLRSKTGPSRYNSFFYAAEYGTGIAENVGGDEWVNRDPATKQKDGKWFFTDPMGRGALLRGQGGLHFLFDARARTPRKMYYDRMGELLPAHQDKFLNKRTGGNVRWVS